VEVDMLRRIVTLGLAIVLGFGLLGGGAWAAQPAPAGRLNINSATVDQLEALPGVGPKLAARIIEYRQKAGSFRSVQELMNVKGIGEKNFEKLQPFLNAGAAEAKAPAK
jgi:competence ComEA-like helix-hairpin-helix protein